MKNLNSTPSQETTWRSVDGPSATVSVDQSLPFAAPTRRQFLVNCSVLAVAAAVAPTTLGAPIRGRKVPLEQIGPGDYARQLNTTFLVRAEQAAPVEILLIEIRPLGSLTAAPNAEDADNEKFALLFRGPSGSPLSQDTYAFEHPRIGSFVMFIVPVGCLDQSHCYYEAVFNRPARGPKGRSMRTNIR